MSLEQWSVSQWLLGASIKIWDVKLHTGFQQESSHALLGLVVLLQVTPRGQFNAAGNELAATMPQH